MTKKYYIYLCMYRRKYSLKKARRYKLLLTAPIQSYQHTICLLAELYRIYQMLWLDASPPLSLFQIFCQVENTSLFNFSNEVYWIGYKAIRYEILKHKAAVGRQIRLKGFRRIQLLYSLIGSCLCQIFQTTQNII